MGRRQSSFNDPVRIELDVRLRSLSPLFDLLVNYFKNKSRTRNKGNGKGQWRRERTEGERKQAALE